MTRSRTLPASPEARLEQAAAWLVKLDSLDEAQLTPEEMQAWDEWAADEANRADFDELAALRQRITSLAAVRWPTGAELRADHVADMEGKVSARNAEVSRRAWGIALAASVLLVVTSAMLLRFRPHSPNRLPLLAAQTYSTATGEQRRIVLPDGSSITMGGESRLSVAYTLRQRNVTLDRGEALFSVEHNATRPFRVYAGSGVITDLGTRFDVLRTTHRVTVTVTEGAVVVAPAPVLQQPRALDGSALPAPNWLPEQVTRGEGMSYQAQGEASAVERVDPRLAIAWSRGTLVYDRRPLSEVIEDVTRYWGHQVVLGPGTGDLLYSGTVGEQHIGAWIRELPNIFPVDVTQASGGKVSIRLREH